MVEHRIAGLKPEAITRVALGALVLAYAGAYAALSLLRLYTFHAEFDLPYYVRLVWGMGHGHPDMPIVGSPHFLGLHLEPILWPLAGLSALGAPVAPVILVLQAVAVALLAWPAYRLGARHLGGRGGGLVAALAALLYPTVTVSTLHAFHPSTLALAPILAALDALDENRLGRAALFGLLALACREDIALCFACAALVEAYRRSGRERAAFLAAAAALILYFAVYVFVVQPRYAGPRTSYGMHFGIAGAAARTGTDVAAALLAHPLAAAARLLAPDRLAYFAILLTPVGLLALLAPRFLAGAAPIVLINLLSDFPRVRTIEAHYATTIVPFAVAAAIQGGGVARLFLARAARQAPGAGRWLVRLPLALLLAAALVSHVLHGASPMAVLGDRFSFELFRDGADAASRRATVAAVPRDISVSAPPRILALIAERPRPMHLGYFDDGAPVDLVIP